MYYPKALMDEFPQGKCAREFCCANRGEKEGKAGFRPLELGLFPLPS